MAKLYYFKNSLSWNIKRYRHALSKRLAPESGLWAIRKMEKDLPKILGTDTPTIVDGGAAGGTIGDFLKIFPKAKIIGYEPVPESAESLREKFKDNNNVVIREAAMGAENKKASFNVTEYHNASSLLAPLKTEDEDSPYKMEKIIEVEQVALKDDLDESVNFIKLDLQGGELDALKGAGQDLMGAKAIYVEVNLYPTYENQPSFAEIDQHLRDCGFRLFNFYDLYTSPGRDDLIPGQLTYGDALYVRQ